MNEELVTTTEDRSVNHRYAATYASMPAFEAQNQIPSYKTFRAVLTAPTMLTYFANAELKVRDIEAYYNQPHRRKN